MKCYSLAALLLALLLTSGTAAQTVTLGNKQIDFEKARLLLEKQRGGDSLSDEEKAYLSRAREMLQRLGRGRLPTQRQPADRLIPLTDLKATEQYEGEEGGLYGKGSNSPPDPLVSAAEEALAMIVPRDQEGDPSPDGKIVFVSISMSNATQEFSVFKKLADADPRRAEHVEIVDCAQGGKAMAEWASPNAPPWQVALQRLEAAGVTPAQVQVAWVKLANVAPTGSLEDHGRKLEADTIRVLQNAKQRFPNLRIAYLGSRIWAGNATGALNPEPYAYETAFAVRWLIQRQLSEDPRFQEPRMPLLLWGPYLWAEGERGRKIDDLSWNSDDFTADGVHPSPTGRRKVAEMLLEFVTSDPLAKVWFTRAEINAR